MGRMAPMSSPWLASKTPVGPPTAANPTVRQLLYAAVVTGGWSGPDQPADLPGGSPVRGDLHRLGPGRAVRAPPVQWSSSCSCRWRPPCVALLASLARGRPHARRIVFWVGTLGAIASLIPVLNQPASVGWFARIVLASMHVVTWFLVVPQIARIVGDSEPGQHVDRDE